MNRLPQAKVYSGPAGDGARTFLSAPWSPGGRADRNVRAPEGSLPRSRAAFSLLEVMIAGGIFFMAIFAILAMVSSVLRNARSLRQIPLDAGMVAAQIGNTNRLEEGASSGDFGDLYPGYSWDAETFEVATNGLWQVDIVVRRRGVRDPVDRMSVYLFRPESQSRFGPRLR